MIKFGKSSGLSKEDIREAFFQFAPAIVPSLIPQMGSLPPVMQEALGGLLTKLGQAGMKSDENGPTAQDLIIYSDNTRQHGEAFISDSEFRTTIHGIMMDRENPELGYFLAWMLLSGHDGRERVNKKAP